MSGELSFSEALSQRLSLLKASKSHIDALVTYLHDNISDSFLRNKSFLEEYSENILVVSSGFKEFIIPIIESLGLNPANVYANTFEFDPEGNITGCDQNNVLAQTGGKIKLMESLKLDAHVSVIGDGFTDYEIKNPDLQTASMHSLRM